MEQAQQKTKLSRKTKIITWCLIILLPISYFLLGSIDTSKDDYSAVTPAPRTAPPDEENGLLLIKPVFTKTDNYTWLNEYVVDEKSDGYLFAPDHQYDSAFWEKTLETHKDDLALLKQAYQKDYFYEKIVYDPSYSSPLINLISANRLLGASILFHIHQQDWDQVIEDLWLAKRFSTRLIEQSDTIIGFLVAIAVDSDSFNHFRLLADLPNVPDDVLQESIKILSEPRISICKKAMTRAFKHEFKYTESLLEMFKEGQVEGFSDHEKILGIPFCLHKNRTLNAQAKITERFIAFESMTPPQIQKELDQIQNEITIKSPWKLALPNGGGKFLLSESNRIIGRQAIRAYLNQVNCDLYRLKLALRLYFNQHGELPDTLSEVYPPIGGPVFDHFAPSSLPYRYSKTRTRIWSCGDNLIDDGGKDPTSAFSGSDEDIMLKLNFAETKEQAHEEKSPSE